MEYWSRDDVVADLDVVEHRRSFAGHTVYRVVLQVFAANEFVVKLNEVFVWRRFSEFKKLHRDLKAICLLTDELDAFPEFIKGKIFGRFEEHILKERQESAANFLRYVARNPVLCKSLYVKKFFEGAVKVTPQPFTSSLSEDPTLLCESHERLSLSGQEMEDTSTIDAAEEEQEDVPSNQPRGTWNDRQPTPEPLESNNTNGNMQYTEATDANDQRLNVDGQNIEGNVIEVGNEQSRQPNESPETVATCNPVIEASNQNDDDVFGDFEAYKEDDGQWLRKAFSVCSDGDDIEQLASEADEILPLRSKEMNSAEIIADSDTGINTDAAIRCNLDSTGGLDADFNGDANADDGCELIAVPSPGAIAPTDSKPCVNSEEDANEDDELDSDALVQTLCDLPVLSNTLIDEDTDDTGLRSPIGDNPDEENKVDGIQQFPTDDNEMNLQGCGDNINACNESRNQSIVYEDGNTMDHLKIKNKDDNENDTAPSEVTDHACRLSETGQNDLIKRIQSDVPTHEDSSSDPKTKDEFSICLDDKLKRRIQRVIEHDDYIYQSSLAMSEAIELEEQQKYQSSFKLYKLGIGLLLQGVQQDADEERRMAVRRKAAQYLLRAENVYKCCIMQAERTANARKKPICLADCRTVGIIDKIILVERCATNELFALKVLHKCGVEYKNRKGGNSTGGTKFINSKYMVKLHRQTESSTGIHLFLEYIPGGLLWMYLELDLTRDSSSKDLVNNHFLSAYNGKNSSGSKLSLQEGSRKRVDSNSKNLEIKEDRIRVWIAEVVSVLSDLHKYGIICRDLNPRNILIDEDGHVKLTYFSNIKGVEYSMHDSAITRSYAAPEARGVFPLTPAADWWSLGAILFELLTRKSLYSCYPNGIHSHSIINLPKPVSNEAWSLLAGLLRYNQKDRLGSGVAGCEEIKSHPFFASIDWNKL